MSQIVKIDGVQIKNPSIPIQITKYAVTKAGRVASALMAIDFLAEKSTFQFNYESLRADDLATITDIVEAFPTMFHTLTINENGIEASYTVYFGAVKRTPYRTDNNGYWYYKNIEFQAIQQ